MTVNSVKEAWKEADKLFPTDYMKDDISSASAGYDIYKSTLPGCNAWISDLGCRLEINLENGKTVNIRIEDKPETETEPETKLTDEEIKSAIEAEKAAKEYGEKITPHRIKSVLKIEFYVPGYEFEREKDDRVFYGLHKFNKTEIAGNIVEGYCKKAGIAWKSISDIKIDKYNGHYIVGAIVEI